MKNIGTQCVKVERLILMKITASDAEDMFNNWVSDSEVTKYATWQPHKTI